jgi:hypothetical protein
MSFSALIQPRRAETTKVQALSDYVRGGIAALGDDIQAGVPECRERSLALTKLEEASFWVQAAIARNQTQISPAPEPSR